MPWLQEHTALLLVATSTAEVVLECRKCTAKYHNEHETLGLKCPHVKMQEWSRRRSQVRVPWRQLGTWYRAEQNSCSVSAPAAQNDTHS
jgi:hypothetical protein